MDRPHRFLLVRAAAFCTAAALIWTGLSPAVATAAEPYALSISQRNAISLAAHGVPPNISQGANKLADAVLGKEDSECEAHGRRSTASGAADVLLLGKREDGMSIVLSASTTAMGGHYRTCGLCASGKCVGVFGHDTRATSSAASNADIAVTFPADAADGYYFLDVGVAAQGKPPVIRVTDQGGKAVAPTAVDSNSFKVQATAGAIYYISAALASQANNEGGCCSENANHSARVDVNVRKAPWLSSHKGMVPFIGGGKPTSAFNNVGALLLNGDLHCTGTLVGGRTILTAAHCLKGYENQISSMTFMTGTSLDKPTFGPVSVAEFIFPNDSALGFNFNEKTLEDDIGLVYLAKPTGITTVALHNGKPSWDDIKKRSAKLTYVGFGYDVDDGQPTKLGIKRAGSWPVNHVENRVVLFDVGGKSTCQGDSGGPAFLVEGLKTVQVAVTSKGLSDCSSGVETRVDAYLSWLEKRIK